MTAPNAYYSGTDGTVTLPTGMVGDVEHVMLRLVGKVEQIPLVGKFFTRSQSVGAHYEGDVTFAMPRGTGQSGFGAAQSMADVLVTFQNQGGEDVSFYGNLESIEEQIVGEAVTKVTARFISDGDPVTS